MPSLDLSGAISDPHLVALWLAGRPESTARVYRVAVETFLEGLSGREGGLKTLTAAEAIEWAEGLAGEPATRARKVSTVKSLLTFAWRTGYTLYNVGRVLRCVKVPSKVHERILEEPEVKELFGASEGRDRAFIRLMYATGARVGELCGLRWIDLAQPGRMSVLGKGSKVRTLTVPQRVLDEVKALRPKTAQPSDPVFTSKKKRPGSPLGVRDAREIVYRARNRANQDRKVSPHWLRHSHATHALDHGCKLHILSQSLGHANISTTSTYIHVRPNKGSADFLDL